MSATDFHKQAQELSTLAAQQLAIGKKKRAVEQFSEAAILERKAFDAVPSDRIRTRGILAISTASLYYKARKLTDAKRFLYQVLGSEQSVQPPHQKQLQELLEVVSDELTLDGGEYLPQQIDVTLRGGQVGYGTAPLGLAISKVAQFQRLVARVGEFVAGLPLRLSGLIPEEIAGLMQARVTQPLSGSYRFSVKLVEPAQGELFNQERHEAAQKIAPLLMDVLRVATSEKTQDKVEFEKLVPDVGYRRAMVQLLDQIAPDESSLTEVEVSSQHKPENKPAERQHVSIFKETKTTLKKVLKETRSPDAYQPAPEDLEATLVGTLRAAHLNECWLIIMRDGQEQRCETAKDLLDDVIGPLMNRKVEIVGHWRSSRGKHEFRMTDISAAP